MISYKWPDKSTITFKYNILQLVVDLSGYFLLLTDFEIFNVKDKDDLLYSRTTLQA